MNKEEIKTILNECFWSKHAKPHFDFDTAIKRLSPIPTHKEETKTLPSDEEIDEIVTNCWLKSKAQTTHSSYSIGCFEGIKEILSKSVDNIPKAKIQLPNGDVSKPEFMKAVDNTVSETDDYIAFADFVVRNITYNQIGFTYRGTYYKDKSEMRKLFLKQHKK